MELSAVRFGAAFTAQVVDPDGCVVDCREGHNIMTALGLTAIAQTLMWSGVEDVAATLAIPGPSFLAPLWGAVGSGSTTPAPTLTALVSEITRATVSSGGYTAASGSGSALAAFLFYMPGPASGSWNLNEAGLFASASGTSGSGLLIDYWKFSSTLTVTYPNSLVLQAQFAIAEG